MSDLVNESAIGGAETVSVQSGELDPIGAFIVELLSRPYSEVVVLLEGYEAQYPLMASKIRAFRSFLGVLNNNLPAKGLAGYAEVVALIQTGSGPVVLDIGDTA